MERTAAREDARLQGKAKSGPLPFSSGIVIHMEAQGGAVESGETGTPDTPGDTVAKGHNVLTREGAIARREEAFEYWAGLPEGKRTFNEVAERFEVSLKTVRTWVQNCRWKARLKKRKDYVSRVMEAQIVEEGDKEARVRHLSAYRALQEKATEAIGRQKVKTFSEAARALDMAIRGELAVREEVRRIGTFNQQNNLFVVGGGSGADLLAEAERLIQNALGGASGGDNNGNLIPCGDGNLLTGGIGNFPIPIDTTTGDTPPDDCSPDDDTDSGAGSAVGEGEATASGDSPAAAEGEGESGRGTDGGAVQDSEGGDLEDSGELHLQRPLLHEGSPPHPAQAAISAASVPPGTGLEDAHDTDAGDREKQADDGDKHGDGVRLLVRGLDSWEARIRAKRKKGSGGGHSLPLPVHPRESTQVAATKTIAPLGSAEPGETGVCGGLLHPRDGGGGEEDQEYDS